MTIFDEDVPMSFYVQVQNIKDSIRDLLNNTEGVDVGEITEDEMERILTFLHKVDDILEDHPDAEDRCTRLRNLTITLYALVIKGERI